MRYFVQIKKSLCWENTQYQSDDYDKAQFYAFNLLNRVDVHEVRVMIRD